MQVMKKTMIVLSLLALAGCGIGYNRVLFVTRSNAGVDLDAEPPTAEIAVSRTEGVIEPTFEDGKTLPVSASFSSNQGGFASFFAGASSTFATGEAAAAITALYNAEDAIYKGGDQQGKVTYLSTEDPRKTEFTAYNGEDLADRPRRKSSSGKKKDIDLVEPGLTKPVFLGTDTSFGLKVGWNNPASPAPSSVKLGFNRKELAWAPVSIRQLKYPADPNANPDSNPNYRVNIPSLLATLDMNVSASGAAEGTDLNWLQYFATGRAATNLVLRRAVREAMLRRSDPANAAAFDSLVDKEETKLVAFILLNPMYLELERLAGENNADANDLVARMNSLAPDGLEIDFTECEYSQEGNGITLSEGPQALTGEGFSQVRSYYTRLSDSIEYVEKILAWSDADFTKLNDEAIDPADLPNLRQQLLEHLLQLREQRTDFENNVLRNATVINDVVDYFFL